MQVKIMTETVGMYPVTGTDYVSPRFAYESSKTIDWSDSSDRKWLMNHMHWAMNNGRKVSIEPDNAYRLFHEKRARESGAPASPDFDLDRPQA